CSHSLLPAFPTRRSSDLCTATSRSPRAATRSRSWRSAAPVWSLRPSDDSSPWGSPVLPHGVWPKGQLMSTEIRDIDADYEHAHRSEEHTSELQSRENLVC